MWAKCCDCNRLVEAEITHNGVMYVGHYICCGWGHQRSPDDLLNDEDPGVMSWLNAQAEEEATNMA